MKIYAAYGSNLNEKQMALRCPTARLFTTGVIHDYTLTFKGAQGNGYADIEPCEGSVVPVKLWCIDELAEKALDRYEGFPVFYIKKDVQIDLGNGKETDAMVYVMTAERRSTAMPSEVYFNTILEGYSGTDMDLVPFLEAVQKVKNGG